MYNFRNELGLWECSVAVWYGKGKLAQANLPCYPEEASESISATWSSQPIMGRSNHIHAYTGTNPAQVSFSFDLRRDYKDPSSADAQKGIFWGSNGAYIDRVIRILKSGCFPSYGNSITPPRTVFTFGKFKASGILNSVSFQWKGPIIQEYYSTCSVSVNMTVVNNTILGGKDIIDGKTHVQGFAST